MPVRSLHIALALALLAQATAAAQNPTEEGAADGVDIIQVQNEVRPGADLLPAPDQSSPTRGIFYLSGGVNFVEPFFQSNPAFHVSAFGLAVRTFDFEHELAQAPHFALGYDGDSGWGVRFSWFEFDQAAERIAFRHPGTASINGATVPLVVQFPFLPGLAPISVGNTGQQLSFSSGLDLDVIDLELTRRFLWGDADVRFSLGGRSMYLFQDYRGYIGRGPVPPVPPPAVVPSDFYLRSTNTFNGAGPTTALEIVQPLGGGFISLYGNGRLSVVWGEFDNAAWRVESSSGVVVSRTRVASSHDETMFQGELEIGLEASRQFGGMLGFVRTGVVGQLFEDVGNGIVPGGGSLRFLGLALHAGLEF